MSEIQPDLDTSQTETEIPSPEEMLERLRQVDPKYFDIKAVAQMN